MRLCIHKKSVYLKNQHMFTVTLNPAIDETLVFNEIITGHVNRALTHEKQIGGKGVNVSLLMAQYGVVSTAMGFLGQENADLFQSSFQAHGIDDEFIRVLGMTRTSIKLVSQAKKETTDINTPGLTIQTRDLEGLLQKLSRLVQTGDWVILGGRLPSGVGCAEWIVLLQHLKALGAKLAVDSSGEALLAAIDFGVDMIKPNEHELAEIYGYSPHDEVARDAVLKKISTTQVPHIIFSMGTNGARYMAPDGVIEAKAPPARVVSTVGAGDATLAGYLVGLRQGEPLEIRVRMASVFAWSVLESVSRSLCTPDIFLKRMKQIEIKSIGSIT
jgi:1-phosphofructokinase